MRSNEIVSFFKRAARFSLLGWGALLALSSGCGVAIRSLRGLAQTSANSVSASRVFHRGIAFGPSATAPTIGGRVWLTQAAAVAEGLTFSTASMDDDSSGGDQGGFPTAPFPPVDADTEAMLRNVTYGVGTDLAFDLPVPSGRYLVYVWVWENWADYARSFDLAFEGTTLEAAVGLKSSVADWRRLGPYSVEVVDAGLSVELVRNAGNPMLSGLEIYATDASATPSALAVSGPSAVARGTCTPVVVSRVDALGDAVNPGAALNVDLASGNGSSLHSDPFCGSAIVATTIPADRSGRTVYLLAPNAATVTVTASAAGLASGSRGIAVSSAGFADNFEDDTLDPAVWRQWSNGYLGVEQNQRIELSPPANSTAWPGLLSLTFFDLTGASIVFEVGAVLAPFSDSYSIIYLCETSGCYEITFRNGAIYFAKDGVATFSSAHDPVAQRYVRVSHAIAGDAISLSASPDGAAWTALHSEARTLGPVFQPQFGAGSLVGRPVPGTFAIERFYAE